MIYTEKITSRLRYVLNFIFRDCLGTNFGITDNLDEFKASEDPGINYSGKKIEGKFNIPCSGLLEGAGIGAVDAGLCTEGPVPLLFCMESPPPGLKFDLFAAVFYMISRYEEYLPFKPDRHGRFEAAESLAGKNGFLELPVVDLWIREFGEKLVEFNMGLKLTTGEFRFLPTCDIDLPYAYLHRGKARTLGARVKAGFLGTGDRQLRKDILSGKKKDPFDTFSEIKAIHALHKIRPRIFFLTSRYGKHDKSISPKSQAFKTLVKQTMKYADVGIHPSFRASDNSAELKKEIAALFSITGEEIINSRQHYLKFKLPGSYREYLAAGIREEYSMGYASAAGFRAGTSRPFYFYDLMKEEETSLRVTPFQVMDRTLKDYMGLTPGQALEKTMAIARTIRSVGGTFCSIWHNDAFGERGEWKGWKDVYLQMINSLAG